MHKTPYVFPICGGRKVDHLKGNIAARALSLSDEDMQQIDDAWPFDVGFPSNFMSDAPSAPKGPGDVVLSKQGGEFDYVDAPKPFRPRQK